MEGLILIKGRTKIISISILGLALFLGASLLFKNHLTTKKIHAEKIKTFKQIKQAESKTGNPFTYQKKQVKEGTLHFFIPTDAKQQPNELIEKEMIKLSQQLLKESRKKNELTDSEVYLTFQTKKTQEPTQNFTVSGCLFAKKEGSFRKMNQKKNAPIVLTNKTGKQFVLGDIFKSNDSLADELKQRGEEIIMSNQTISLEKIEEIGNLDYPNDWTDSNFTYDADNLTIPLKKNSLGLEKISYPIEAIANLVNPEFLPLNKTLPPTTNSHFRPGKKIALTFDDGPKAEVTLAILNSLKKYNAHATFFVLGQEAANHPDLLNQILADGHELGNHSWNHSLLTGLNPNNLDEELLKTQFAVYQATKQFPKYFRPPYGGINSSVAKSLYKPIIQWSVDTEDWKIKNPKRITNRALSGAYDGAIILMHDIYPTTQQSLDNTLKGLQQKGYQFVTISELLENPAKPLHQYFGSEDERKI